MIDVVVVSCELTKDLYYLAPNSLELKMGNMVVFEDDNGELIGKVCRESYQEKTENLDLPLERVLRIATEEDFKTLKKKSRSFRKGFK